MGYETTDGLPGHQRMRARVHPDDLPALDVDVARCRAGGGDWDREYRIMRADGVRWVHGKGHAVCDPSGRPIELIGVNLDITDRKEREEHVQFLVRELDHRTMNLLSVASALIGHSVHQGDTVEAFAARCTDRLFTLRQAQRLLSQANWTGADLADTVSATITPFLDAEDRVMVEGPAAHLHPKAVETITLALNELMTNAVKYGALSVPNGRVEIVWARASNGAQPGVLQMSWLEKDVAAGPAADPQRLWLESYRGFPGYAAFRRCHSRLSGRRRNVDDRRARQFPDQIAAGRE